MSPRARQDDLRIFSSGRPACAAWHDIDPQAKAKQKAELDFRASGKQRRYSWDYDEMMDIFTTNPDGSDLRRLTTVRVTTPRPVTRRTAKLVFSSTRSAYADNLTAEEKKLQLRSTCRGFGDCTATADGSVRRA